jgi:hypothetical protein
MHERHVEPVLHHTDDVTAAAAAPRVRDVVEQRVGHVELIIGPLSCGKTTELCRRLKRCAVAGMDGICLVPFPTPPPSPTGTSSMCMIQTHDGARSRAIAVEHLRYLDTAPPSLDTIDEELDPLKTMVRTAEIFCSSWPKADHLLTHSFVQTWKLKYFSIKE